METITNNVYHAAIDAAGDAVWQWDMAEKQIQFSERLTEILGYSSETLGSCFEDVQAAIAPEDVAGVRERLDAYLEQREAIFRHEFRMRDAQGNYRWVLSRGKVIKRAETGEPLLMVGTLTDISERKRLEQAVLENSDHYRTLTDNSPLPVVIHAAGEMLYVNKKCVELLGGSCAEEFIGHSIMEAIHPDSRAAAFDRVQRIMSGDPDVEAVELVLTRKDGTLADIETTGIATHFEGRDAIYVVGRDITDRKKIEAQEKKRLAEIEALYALSDAVSRAESVERVFDVAMDSIRNSLRADRVSILLFDDQDKMRFHAWRGLSETYRNAADGHSPWSRHEFNPAPIVIDDIETNEAFAYFRPIAASEGVRAFGFVPLVQNGELIGKFMIYFNEPHQFSNAEIRLAESIAFHIAFAIERKRTEEEITQLAYYDPLTGLPNRRLLFDRIQQSMAASMRTENFAALMFLDLDFFKTINDSQGHDVGDLLLADVAKRLLNCVRDGDTVSRLGGDEFVVLLESLSDDSEEAAAQAEMVAEKIRSALCHPYHLKKQDFHSTPSIGVVLFKGREETQDNLMKYADTAMYQAKAAGRNSIRFYDPTMQQALQSRMEMELALRQALKKEQFCLHYQIQVNQQGKILGAEALLRWQHPERGMVSPAAFIPLAEETGLIESIGQWVLRTACLQIKAWSDSPLTDKLRISVNVSPRQFRQHDFVAQVREVLTETAIDPALLKIELTEGLVLDNVMDTIEKMQQLRQIGVSFSLDDFGTGYSSLSYLKQLPLNQLKIDQSFVRDLVEDANDEAIVRAIVTMGNAFELNVIAEGVETDAQRLRLEGNGCLNFQGYLFGKPVPITELNRQLQQA